MQSILPLPWYSPLVANPKIHNCFILDVHSMTKRIRLLLARIADCKISPETIDQFISCKTILISATLSDRCSRDATSCAQQAIRLIRFVLPRAPRYPLILLPRLNCYTFHSALGIFLASVYGTLSVYRTNCRNRSRSRFRRICIRKLSNNCFHRFGYVKLICAPRQKVFIRLV